MTQKAKELRDNVKEIKTGMIYRKNRIGIEKGKELKEIIDSLLQKDIIKIGGENG